jgi:hypothetical protein
VMRIYNIFVDQALRKCHLFLKVQPTAVRCPK